MSTPSILTLVTVPMDTPGKTAGWVSCGVECTALSIRADQYVHGDRLELQTSLIRCICMRNISLITETFKNIYRYIVYIIREDMSDYFNVCEYFESLIVI